MSRHYDTVGSLEEARKILAHVVEMRARWGKKYTADGIGYGPLMDAMVWLAKEDSDRITGQDDKILEMRDEITKLKRQLAAAKAREARAKKREGDS
mgnify:CR=1 FL=1